MLGRHMLTLMLFLSGLILSVWSILAMPRAYASYDHDIKHPVIAILLQGIHDGVYPWGNIDMVQAVKESLSAATNKNGSPDADIADPSDDAAGSETADGDAAGGDTADCDTADNDAAGDAIADGDAVGGDTVGGTASDGDAADGTMSDGDAALSEAADLPRSFLSVTDDYFNDALFVGDSRMVGLSEYCEPLDTRADFYVKKALTIYNLADGKAIRSFDGTPKTLWEVLDAKKYGKIYLMVGINEIGVGNSEYFKDAYAEVVNRIRDAQPDAIIFINGIMHVSAAKSNSDNLYNNANINARNAAIKTLADNKTIFYLDINEAVDDENGDLRQDITFDDVHLKGSCYEPWHEYLLSHGIE